MLSVGWFQAKQLCITRKKKGFRRHSRWLYIQQQSSSSSSNRFTEHDVSTWTLGPSSGIRPSFIIDPRRPEFPGRNVVFSKTIAGRRGTLLLKKKKKEANPTRVDSEGKGFKKESCWTCWMEERNSKGKPYVYGHKLPRIMSKRGS